MREFSKTELQLFWHLSNDLKTPRSRIMDTMNLSNEDFDAIQDQANAFYNVRDKRSYFKKLSPSSEVVGKIIRPPAKYDNKSREERIDEILNS